MRTPHREADISAILRGLRNLGLLEIVNFKVVCAAGACWSRDTIYLENKYRGQPASDNAKKFIEDSLDKAFLNKIKDDKQDDGWMSNMTTASPHEVYVEWVDELPLKWFDIKKDNK